MRWIKVPSSRYSIPSSLRKVGHRVPSTGCWVLLAVVTFLSAARSAEERHISVYSPVAIYTLPLLERSGHEYVGLLELLEPLGRVSSETNGRALRLRYNAVDAEFIAGKIRAKIHGHDFDLAAPFLIENSRGLVPLNSLATMLPRFLGAPVNFHEAARRLFVGDVGVQPSFRLDAGNPPRVVVTFSAPVNPTISTEPGKLRMVFKHDPVVSPGSQSIAFDSKVITHADYSENDGAAELDVDATDSLMANFSSDRRTIIVSAVAQGAVGSGTPATPGGVEQATGSAQTSASVPAVNTTSGAGSSSPHRILAMVDPGHGGDERGAALSDTLAEKDVTLGFGRLLRHELETRGFAVALLRDGDTSSTLDQRAAAANTAHAGIYISLHAVSQGNGARIYTALLPVEGQSKGAFHAWNAAQALALPISRIVSAAIVAEMQKREFPVRASSASLRPLNNVFMPAVAVELAPGTGGVADLTSANYQQRAASAIADAVAAVRDRLGVQQ
jgi:N-acetylmuramoyl-L-alanine amidase